MAVRSHIHMICMSLSDAHFQVKGMFGVEEYTDAPSVGSPCSPSCGPVISDVID